MVLLDKELILECLNKGKNFFPNIRKFLKVSKQELSVLLDELVSEGIVYFEKGRNEYYIIKKGKVQVKDAGYGFISVPGEENDYFASKYELDGVYDGDEVEFYAVDTGDSHLEANIIKTIKRNHTFIIGKYKETTRKGKMRAYIVSSNPKFPVKALVVGKHDAKPGMIVYGSVKYMHIIQHLCLQNNIFLHFSQHFTYSFAVYPIIQKNIPAMVHPSPYILL